VILWLAQTFLCLINFLVWDLKAPYSFGAQRFELLTRFGQVGAPRYRCLKWNYCKYFDDKQGPIVSTFMISKVIDEYVALMEWWLAGETEKNLAQCLLPITNPTWTDLGHCQLEDYLLTSWKSTNGHCPEPIKCRARLRYKVPRHEDLLGNSMLC
jgi:hypothetical protein